MSDEHERTRLDRELVELLQELRVVLPGVQVLFAFLLTVPFSDRFEDVTALQRRGYFLSLLCAAAAAALLIAPSTYHRVQWRARDKATMLVVSNWLALSGTVFLAVSMCAALFVVTDVLFTSVLAAVVAGVAALVFVLLWYGLPLSRRLRGGTRSGSG